MKANRLLLSLLLGPASVAAQRELAIEHFDAAIHVQADAAIDVTETIEVRFTGSWNGLYRTIPVTYHTPQGFNWTLRLDDVRATDQDGHALRLESSRERHYIKYKIWVPGAQDATRTVVLHYRARNGLRFFEDHDELYWNVTGDEWDVPLGAATAQIDLPTGASGIRSIAFNGVYGSTDRDAKIDRDGTSLRINMPHELGYHEGLTVVVGWDKGVVTPPSTADKVMGFLAANWPLAIPIPVFLLAFITWRRRGRDPEGLPIAVQYEPPKGLTPGEAGVLVDNSADMRDITATLVDLAVRGYLRIEERDDRKLLGLIGSREYVLHKLTPPEAATALAPHERAVYDGVFSGRGDEVELSDLQNEFYKVLAGIKNKLFDELLERGYYHARPDKVKGRWVALAIVSGSHRRRLRRLAGRHAAHDTGAVHRRGSARRHHAPHFRRDHAGAHRGGGPGA